MQIIACPNSREYFVGQRDFRAVRRDEKSAVREYDYKRDLAHIHAFAGHIRTGDYHNAALVGIEKSIVWNEVLSYPFDDGVPSLFDPYFLNA